MITYDLAEMERRFAASGAAALPRTPPGGCDVVTARAALYDCVPVGEVTRTRRQAQKNIDFSMRYGTAAPDLVLIAFHDIPREEARSRLALVETEPSLQAYVQTEEGTLLLKALRRAAAR